MPDRHAILDCDGCDQAIRSRSNRDTPSASEAAYFRRLEKESEGEGIAEDGYCQKRSTKCVTLCPGPKALKDLLHYRTACDKPNEVLLSNRAAMPGA